MIPHPKIKFQLPVNAYLGGMRHLGGGVFAGEAFYREDGSREYAVHHLIEGTTHEGGEWPESPWRTEEFIDPLDDGRPLSRRVGFIQMPGGLSEMEYAKKHGISLEELTRRVDLHR